MDAVDPSYHVEFQEGNGRLFKVTAKTGFSRGFGLPQVGNAVRVVYAPWNPSHARIASSQHLFLTPFIFTAVGLFIVIYDYKSVLLAVDWLVRSMGGF